MRRALRIHESTEPLAWTGIAERCSGLSWLTAQMVTRAAEDSFGLPVALQLVALPWREELCLRVMTELERALPPPGSFCLSAVGSGGATAAIKETQIASDLAGPHHALAPEPRPCAVTETKAGLDASHVRRSPTLGAAPVPVPQARL